MKSPSFFRRPKGFLLHVFTLRLLRDEPMHGYEIMKRIEQMTQGRWTPSHSMLYKMLESLEEDEYITSEKDFKGEVERTIYTITRKGKRHAKEELGKFARLFSNLIISDQMPNPMMHFSEIILENLPLEERKTVLIRMRDQLKQHLGFIEEELSKL